ncbi:MAG: hypothetical protein IJI78_05560 [Oscillospiraceae bacterium]|nr:hypothetical protein [Oscillospiraceae bacterium]
MSYSGSPFIHAYDRFVRAGHAKFINRMIAAIIFSMVTLVITQGITLTVPEYSRFIPDFWTNGLLGSAYVYTLLTSYCLFFWRIVETKLFSYADIESGKWNYAKNCGADIKPLLWAKYFSQIIPSLFCYLLGAAITLVSVYFIFQDDSALVISIACVGVGALSLAGLLFIESIFAALGIRKFLLSVLVFLTAFGIFAAWNHFGFLRFNYELAIRQAIQEIYRFDMPLLPAAVAALLLLSVIICTTVPAKRIVNYNIEKMDSTTFDRLQVESGIEIFEKNGENFDLVYTAEPSGKKKK